MGWSTGYRTKEEALRSCGWLSLDIVECKSCKEGEWAIIRHEGKLRIAMVRCSFSHGSWGEGGIWGEECGPYEDGCPVGWFDIVPLPTAEDVGADRAEWAAQFRERVRNQHAAAKRQFVVTAQIRPGSILKLPGHWKPCGPFTAVEKKGRSWIVTTEHGDRMKMGPKALSVAEVAEEVPAHE